MTELLSTGARRIEYWTTSHGKGGDRLFLEEKWKITGYTEQ